MRSSCRTVIVAALIMAAAACTKAEPAIGTSQQGSEAGTASEPNAGAQGAAGSRTTDGFSMTLRDSLDEEVESTQATFCRHRAPAGIPKEQLRLSLVSDGYVVLVAGVGSPLQTGYLSTGSPRGYGARLIDRRGGEDATQWKRLSANNLWLRLTEITPTRIKGTFRLSAASPEDRTAARVEGDFQAVPDSTCGGE